MKIKSFKLGKYFFEFASVFIAVIAAFALDNWNDNRKDRIAEEKILIQIMSGLQSDLKDAEDNKESHEYGLKACYFFNKLLSDVEVSRDSIPIYYISLTNDNISINTNSGYESLKSKGLEIVQNDSLLGEIISLYEFDYEKMRKMEEEAIPFQVYQNYGERINNFLANF